VQNLKIEATLARKADQGKIAAIAAKAEHTFQITDLQKRNGNLCRN
jgi:hypothetical protein